LIARYVWIYPCIAFKATSGALSTMRAHSAHGVRYRHLINRGCNNNLPQNLKKVRPTSQIK